MITASIVLFQSNVLEIKNNIDSICASGRDIKFYLIDNSAVSHISFFCRTDSRIEYIHNEINIGFGRGHNIALKKAIDLGAQYHFIINPDVDFNINAIVEMVEYMVIHKEVGMMMPKVLNRDGSIQFLPKLLPNPFNILMRKLKWPDFYYKKFIDRYEMRTEPNNIVYCTPVLSGCFSLLRIESVKDIGGFDERFFMYFEDWDLSRRMFRKYKTIYYPLVSVNHGYESGASKKMKLFFIFFKSFFIYFNKWGWFIDSNRVKWNKYVLSQFTFLRE